MDIQYKQTYLMKFHSQDHIFSFSSSSNLPFPRWPPLYLILHLKKKKKKKRQFDWLLHFHTIKYQVLCICSVFLLPQKCFHLCSRFHPFFLTYYLFSIITHFSFTTESVSFLHKYALISPTINKTKLHCQRLLVLTDNHCLLFFLST